MKACLRLIAFVSFALGCIQCFSQRTKDSVKLGIAEGMVMDSAHNYRLQAATVAVYMQSNNGLVSYQLSNNYGQFKFDDLPVDVPLYIKVTYIGYKELQKKFTINHGNANINLDALYVERMSGELSDVVVSSTAPVVMNGDTLEFNADAFKLDPNAVTEDLLKKLPGVIVWGDGSITVNGKEVSSVLVNGKPFFGGETKIATQNIPKNAVDKVQVYKKSLSNPNPFDSTSEINIQLKAGKDIGLFGKFSAGYGSRDMYELDGNLNFFNKRTQLGIVGAGNNSNKIADSVNTILRNSSYKGVGASIEYQPDFSIPGNNESRAAGFRLDHDFIESPDAYHKNHLKAGYFFKKNTQLLTKDLQSIIALSDGDRQLQKSISSNKQFLTGHDANLRYDKQINNNDYFLGATFHTLRKSADNEQTISMMNNYGDLLSSSLGEQNYFSNTKQIHLVGGYKHVGDSREHGRGLNEYKLKYALDAGTMNTYQLNKTDFTSNVMASPSDNQHIDRKYKGHGDYTDHKISLMLGDFSRLLFKSFWGMSLKLNNDLYYHTRSIVNEVVDKDSLSSHYLTNPYLSVHREEKTYDERPGLRFSKEFFKGLSNRYTKSVTIGLNVDGQFYGTQSRSNHAFQRKEINYQRFIPGLEVSYINSEYGRFHDAFSWSLKSGYIYPTIEQLVPLVDSSNFYNLQLGNPYLRPASKKEFLFGWFHSGFRLKNTFNYRIYLNAGIVDHYFTDSSITDNVGRTAHYLINEDGRKYIGLNGGLNRALKINNNLFLLSLSSSINYSKNPLYVNSVKSVSTVVNSLGKLALLYNYKDNLAVNLEEQYTGYHSDLKGVDRNSFDNKLWSTKFSLNKNLSKRFTVGSNISYNKTTSTAAIPTTFTIWNANIRYRALEGNNLELKFSALDILRQNNSVVNNGSNNILTHGVVNVLENYFMLTIAYFPRKFGLHDKAN